MSNTQDDSDPEVVIMPTRSLPSTGLQTPKEPQKSVPIMRKMSASSLNIFLGVPLLSEREIIHGKRKKNEKRSEKDQDKGKKKKRQTSISFTPTSNPSQHQMSPPTVINRLSNDGTPPPSPSPSLVTNSLPPSSQC